LHSRGVVYLSSCVCCDVNDRLGCWNEKCDMEMRRTAAAARGKEIENVHDAAREGVRTG